MRHSSIHAIALCRLFIAVLLSSAALITSAQAHEMRPAVADVTLSNDAISVRIELSAESLLSGIDASQYSDTNDAPQSEEHDRYRAMDADALATEIRAAWAQLSTNFRTAPDGTSGDWELQSVEVGTPGDIELPRDTVLGFRASLEPGGPVAFGASRELGDIVVRHDGAGEEAFAALLSPGELSPPLPRSGGAAEGIGETFARYVVSGIDHIIPKGLDHILFVLGLFFFSIKFRPLLWQVTAFTAAHTVTLALASLGIVNIPGSIVEPLIAASIVYIAFENIRSDGTLSRARTGVVFAFGLLHGLGFASVLGEFGLEQGRFLISLVGFNIGVELGQLLVIAGAYLAVGLWFGKRDFYRPWIATPASIMIGLVGAWWVIERVFL